MDTTTGIPKLSVATRYTCAQTEINARLTARQSVYIGFAVFTVTAVPLILNFIIKPDSTIPHSVPVSALAGLSVLTWSYASWIRHNDAMIGLLCAYCKAIEMQDDPNNTLGIPAWHTDSQGWMRAARLYRKVSAVGSVGVVLVPLFAVVPAIPHFLFRCMDGYCSTMDLATGLLAILVILSNILASIYVYRSKYMRQQIAKGVFCRDKGGHYSFLHRPS